MNKKYDSLHSSQNTLEAVLLLVPVSVAICARISQVFIALFLRLEF